MRRHWTDNLMTLAWVGIFVLAALCCFVTIDCNPDDAPDVLDSPAVPGIASDIKPGTEKVVLKLRRGDMVKPSEFVRPKEEGR